MSYQEIGFSSGEIVPATKLNQIFLNIRDHIHGRDAPERFAFLIIRPTTDPAAGTLLLDVQNAAGSSLISLDSDGNLAITGKLSLSGSPPLIVASNTLVVNLNADLWNGKADADFIFNEAPASDSRYCSWLLDAYFRYLSSASATGTGWIVLDSFASTLDDLKKQFLRAIMDVYTSDGQTAQVKVQVRKSDDTTVIWESDPISSTALSTDPDTITFYSPCLMAGNTYNADWNETLYYYLYGDPGGYTIYVENYYLNQVYRGVQTAVIG
jgi:hypothetical protein